MRIFNKFTVQLIYDKRACRVCDRVRILRYRRYRRVAEFAEGNVVEADDLYVVGNAIAGFLQCVDAAERYHIG